MSVATEWHKFPCLECDSFGNACLTVFNDDNGKQILAIDAPDECANCGAPIWEEDILEYVADEMLYETNTFEEMWGDIEWENGYG